VPGATIRNLTRAEFDNGAVGRNDFIKNLRREAALYRAAGVSDQVLLSFTTDPYHPGETELTRQTIEILIEHGLAFCTLTKGGTRALRDLDLFRPARDAFATTLTSLDDQFSLKWERNAPVPSNRILALKRFKKAGIFTWVSLEPTLDVAASVEIVKQTHDFVDLYKVGRVNYLPMTKTTDWRDYTERMIEVIAKVNAGAYFKKDLQPYLPAGFDNPLRVPQHH
jgi:DNA repair photolyase